jgi:hypothetical protein
MPFIPVKTLSITGIGAYCTVRGTSNPSVNFVCYSDYGNPLGPYTRLWKTADVSYSSAGFSSASQSYTFTAGTTYYRGYQHVSYPSGARYSYISTSAMESVAMSGSGLMVAIGWNGTTDGNPFSSYDFKYNNFLYIEFVGASASS